jgi:hypothetical protein
MESWMPFKSQAQRRKFAQLLVEGKISPETYEEWNRETGSAKLPDHVKRTKSAKARKGAGAAKRKTAKRATRKRPSRPGGRTRSR